MDQHQGNENHRHHHVSKPSRQHTHRNDGKYHSRSTRDYIKKYSPSYKPFMDERHPPPYLNRSRTPPDMLPPLLHHSRQDYHYSNGHMDRYSMDYQRIMKHDRPQMRKRSFEDFSSRPPPPPPYGDMRGPPVYMNRYHNGPDRRYRRGLGPRDGEPRSIGYFERDNSNGHREPYHSHSHKTTSRYSDEGEGIKMKPRGHYFGDEGRNRSSPRSRFIPLREPVKEEEPRETAPPPFPPSPPNNPAPKHNQELKTKPVTEEDEKVKSDEDVSELNQPVERRKAALEQLLGTDTPQDESNDKSVEAEQVEDNIPAPKRMNSTLGWGQGLAARVTTPDGPVERDKEENEKQEEVTSVSDSKLTEKLDAIPSAKKLTATEKPETFFEDKNISLKSTEVEKVIKKDLNKSGGMEKKGEKPFMSVDSVLKQNNNSERQVEQEQSNSNDGDSLSKHDKQTKHEYDHLNVQQTLAKEPSSTIEPEKRAEVDVEMEVKSQPENKRLVIDDSDEAEWEDPFEEKLIVAKKKVNTEIVEAEGKSPVSESINEEPTIKDSLTDDEKKETSSAVSSENKKVDPEIIPTIPVEEKSKEKPATAVKEYRKKRGREDDLVDTELKHKSEKKQKSPKNESETEIENKLPRKPGRPRKRSQNETASTTRKSSLHKSFEKPIPNVEKLLTDIPTLEEEISRVGIPPILFFSTLRNETYHKMKNVKTLYPKFTKKQLSKTKQAKSTEVKLNENLKVLELLNTKKFKRLQSSNYMLSKKNRKKLREKIQAQKKKPSVARTKCRQKIETSKRTHTRASMRQNVPPEVRYVKNTRSTSMAAADRAELGNIIASSSMLNADVFAQDMVFDKYASAERRVINAAIIPDLRTENETKNDFMPSMKCLTTDLLPIKCQDRAVQVQCFKHAERSVSGALSRSNPVLAALKGVYNKQLICNCPRSVNLIRKFSKPFSDLEKLLFIEKFLQYPKNFNKMSLVFRNKSCADMIEFYYKTKGLVRYKELMREHFHRRKLLGFSSWELIIKVGLKLGIAFPPESGIVKRMEEREVIIGKLANFAKLKEHRTIYSPEVVFPLEEEINLYSLGQYENVEDRQAAISKLLPRETINFTEIVNDSQNSLIPISEILPGASAASNYMSVAANTTSSLSAFQSRRSAIQPFNHGSKNKWTEDEKKMFFEQFKTFGKNWKKVSAFLPNKTVHQVRNYYQNYKVRLNLDCFLPQNNWSNNGENVPMDGGAGELCSPATKTRRGNGRKRSSVAISSTKPESSVTVSKPVDPVQNSNENLNQSKEMKYPQSLGHNTSVIDITQTPDPLTTQQNPVQVDLTEPAVASVLAQLPPAALTNLINTGVLSGLLQQPPNVSNTQALGNLLSRPDSPLNYSQLQSYGNNLELELVQSVRAVFDEIRKKVDVAQLAYANQLHSLTEAYISSKSQNVNGNAGLATSQLQGFQMGLLELQQMISDTKTQLMSEYHNAKTAMLETLVRSGAKGVVLQVFNTEDQVATRRFEQLESNAGFLNLQAVQRVQQHQNTRNHVS